MQEYWGLRLATIAERVKKCAIEDAGPLILQYWQNCSLCSIGILQKAIKSGRIPYFMLEFLCATRNKMEMCFGIMLQNNLASLEPFA